MSLQSLYANLKKQTSIAKFSPPVLPRFAQQGGPASTASWQGGWSLELTTATLRVRSEATHREIIICGFPEMQTSEVLSKGLPSRINLGGF